MTAKALCLICGEIIAVLKDHNIARYNNSKQKTSGTLRGEIPAALRRGRVGLESRHSVFRKQYSDISLHSGQVILLLTCWIKKSDRFLMGNS